jgi:hypothetical protein
MPRFKLTKSSIDSLPTPASDTVYWDAGCPGFGLKVTPKGRKVFVISDGWGRIELAQIHDRGLRACHPSSGPSSCAEDRRSEAGRARSRR